MKTRASNMVIFVLMVFPCIAFVVAATFLSLSILKHYSVPVQTMREGTDPAMARQIMTDAERILREGEETLGQAQKMAEKNGDLKEKMEIVTESYDPMIHGTKIMHLGMIMAEAMLTEGPSLLARDANKVNTGLKTEKSH